MRSPAIPIALLAATALSMLAWVASTDQALLRDWLRHAQFWFLEAQGATLLACTVVALPGVVARLQVGRSTLTAMVAVSAITWLLVTQVAPRTNRIYYDEHIYQGIGQNLADARLAQMCNDGVVEYGVLQCARGEYNKEPYGYPHLLSVAYRLVGVSERVAPAVNALCAVAMVWVVFAAAALLFGNHQAGVLAAIVMMLTPQQIVWAHTAAVEPSAALMMTLAVTAGIAHARLQTTRSLAWMVAAVVSATQFRMEAALVVPVVGLTLALLAPTEFRRARLWWGAVAALPLLAAHVAHVAAVRGESWGSAGPVLSLGYAWTNFPANGPFYIADARSPAAYAVLGAVGLLWRPRRAALVPAALFLAFWGTYLCFYAGSYDFGADVRFSVMTYPGLAILAGRGLSALTSMAPHAIAGVSAHRAIQAAVVALGLQFLWYVPGVRAVGEEAWAARADVAFARRIIPQLSPNSIVLTHNPSIFHLNGRNAAQMSIVHTDPAWVAGHLPSRYAGGVYVHWNAWCGYANPDQRALCEGTLAAFDSTLEFEYRERDFRYAFYKVNTGGTIPKVTP